MSAKKKTRPAASSKSPVASAPAPAPAVQPTKAERPEPVAVAVAAPGSNPSQTPRQKLIANLVLGAVCIYVAMLFLLALDQQFKWGIFGP